MTAFAVLGSSGHAFANGIVTFGLMATAAGFDHAALPARRRHADLGAGPPPRLHHPGADVSRPLGVLAHRHGDLRRAGGAARALHRHRRDGRRHRAWRDQPGRHPLLGAAARSSRSGRDGLRLLRRHEGHGAGQRGADDDVPAGRDDGVRGDRLRDGRIQPDDLRHARDAVAGAAADARARLAALLLQLHVHPVFGDRVSAHRHLLPHRQAAVALQAHRHRLPAVPDGHLAAEHDSRRRGQPRNRGAGHRAEARGAGRCCRRPARR